MASSLCWLRRDLRLHDHAALATALADHDETHVVFVFDTRILGALPDKHDRRLTFIVQALQDLEQELRAHGSSLHVCHGDPVREIPRLARELGVATVHANRDYEPYAKNRDEAVERALAASGVAFRQHKDAVVFEKHEVLNGSGEVYKVFTPYKNKWIETLERQGGEVPDHATDLRKLARRKAAALAPDWHQLISFHLTPPPLEGGRAAGLRRLKAFATHMDDYGHARDFPSVDGTSNLSPYLRHGCVSVREMVRAGRARHTAGAKVWVSEIVWRDFYQVVLDAFPHVVGGSFKPEYDRIKWQGKDAHFRAWCQGETGFPLVDAAMRCLNQTGMIHNRLRMVVASFLCKTLLLDWRRGEAYFAEKLLDFDLAANNGGWQWSSSTGCDAQPYFRIFNPYNHSAKFDPEGVFIRAWVPELAHLDDREIHSPSPLLAPDYPQPIVSYERMRAEALKMYAAAKK
jgi:deoxyribodipyrimidine photo-lyase